MKLKSVLNYATSLSTTRRYSQSRLHIEESVLEHMGFVTYMGVMIGTEIEALSPGTLDIGKLLTKATTHDLEEPITGDVPRPTKYFSTDVKNAFELVAQSGMRESLRGMELQSEEVIWDSWLNAKDGPEGFIIRILDLSAVVWKMHSEITMMGNRTLMVSCDKVHQYLSEVRLAIPDNFDDIEVVDYLRDIIDDLTILSAHAEKVTKATLEGI